MDGYDIEKLNKSQIILLTLLTSFVTSIATGIVTVSLMDQAPPAIAQTVNRIVERTVEKVMPVTQTASAVQEKTIVIKESDLIAQAIEKVRTSIVRVYTADSENPIFIGMGIVLNKSGVITTDAAALAEATDVVVVQNGGQRVQATVSRSDKDSGLAYLVSATSTIDGKVALWMPATLSPEKVSLGQSVFTVYGRSETRVDDGIITTLTTDPTPGLIDTNIPAGSIVAGGPLVDTNGSIVAIHTLVAHDMSVSGFIPSSDISIEPKIPETKEVKK